MWTKCVSFMRGEIHGEMPFSRQRRIHTAYGSMPRSWRSFAFSVQFVPSALR